MPLFNSNINLDNNQLQNAVVHSGSSKPTSGILAGQIFYDTDVNQLQLYNGSAWEGVQTETADGALQFNTALKIGRDADNLLDFTTDNVITFRVGAGDGVAFKASGEIEATSLDIGTGGVDVNGTLEANVVTIAGDNVLTGGIVTTLGTIAQDTIRFISSAADDPMFVIENTANDATGPRILLLKDRGAAAEDNDEVGEIIFAGDNDAQEQTTYAKIVTKIADASDGVEGGLFEIRVASHDAELLPALQLIDGNAEDEVDAIIGSGAASVTTVAGTLTMGTTAAMDNDGLLTVGAQTGITAAANLVTVGTIGTGVWQGTAIASAYLDADTAHLTTAQSFSGAKTFEAHTVQASNTQLRFRDSGIHISSSADGQLDLVADTEIQIAATTIDINGAVVASGDIQATSLDINGNADISGDLTGLDNVTSTNYVVGGHTVNDIDIGTEFVDADDHIMSSGAIVAKFGLIAGSSSVVTTGALNSGSITSGFGTIDTGASAITTTGLISGGSLDIDNVLINGANIGHTDDTDLIALADGAVTVNGSLTVTGTTTTNNVETVSTSSGVIFEGAAADGHDATLKSVVASSDKTYTLPNTTGFIGIFTTDPGTTNVTATTAELNALDLGSTAVGNAIASKAVVLDSNKDYTGVRHFTLSGELDAGSLDVSGNADIAGDLTGLDNITSTNYVVGGHTIDDIDITAEFVDADAHIMSSKAIGARFALKNADTTGTAAIATTVTVADESSDTTCFPLFVTAATGDLAPKSGSNITFNSSSGVLAVSGVTANGFTGDLTGDVTGDVTGNADTATKITSITNSNIVQLAGSQTLTGTKTLNSFKGTGGATVTNILDEDAMGSDSATALATQQSIKAYVDANTAGGREVVLVLNNSVSGVVSSDNITYTVTHSLNTRNVMVEVIRNGANSGDYATVYTDIKRTTDDVITVVFGSARTAGDYTVMIQKIG